MRKHDAEKGGELLLKRVLPFDKDSVEEVDEEKLVYGVRSDYGKKILAEKVKYAVESATTFDDAAVPFPKLHVSAIR